MYMREMLHQENQISGKYHSFTAVRKRQALRHPLGGHPGKRGIATCSEQSKWRRSRPIGRSEEATKFSVSERPGNKTYVKLYAAQARVRCRDSRRSSPHLTPSRRRFVPEPPPAPSPRRSVCIGNVSATGRSARSPAAAPLAPRAVPGTHPIPLRRARPRSSGCAPTPREYGPEFGSTALLPPAACPELRVKARARRTGSTAELCVCMSRLGPVPDM